MSHTGLPNDTVLYPCSDGQPMAETEVHGACMMYVTSALRWWFERHGRTDVHVGSNSFLYDPRAEYLTPPLQGYRLREGEYRPLPAVTVLSNRGVAVASKVLGLELRDEREARMVRLHDRATGEDLPTYEEAERAREAEADARREEAGARRAAEARAAELEARVRALENALAARTRHRQE